MAKVFDIANHFISNKRWWVVIGIFLINFILRTIYITSNPIGLDEPWSIYHAQWDLIPMIKQLIYSDNHPPLYQILLHFTVKFFGIGPLAVRFPSLIFSSLVPAVVFVICTNFINKKVAVIAVLLCTFSSISIYFAHEARNYALFQLLTVVSFYFWLRLKMQPTDKKIFIKLFLVNFLLVYTNYFSAWIFVSQLIASILFFRDVKMLLKKVLLNNLLVALLFLPYLFSFVVRFTSSVSSGSWIKSGPSFTSIFHMFSKYCNQPVPATIYISLVVIAFILLVFKKLQHPQLSLFYFFFFFPVVGVYFMSLKYPMFHERYLFFLLPFFYVIIALITTVLLKGRAFYIGALVIACLSIFSVNINKSNGKNPQELIGYINQYMTKDAVMFIYPDFDKFYFSYHQHPECFISYSTIDSCMNSKNVYPVFYVADMKKIIEHKKPQRIILLYPNNVNNEMEAEIIKGYPIKNKVKLSAINSYTSFTYYDKAKL